MKVGTKINQNLPNVEAGKAAKVGEKGNSEKNKDVKAGALGVADNAPVKLSNQAQAIKKAKEIANQQTVDEAKVARLQKLIDEGKYKVDAEAVADRLVDEQLRMSEA